jgi:hypothetical protein
LIRKNAPAMKISIEYCVLSIETIFERSFFSFMTGCYKTYADQKYKNVARKNRQRFQEAL